MSNLQCIIQDFKNVCTPIAVLSSAFCLTKYRATSITVDVVWTTRFAALHYDTYRQVPASTTISRDWTFSKFAHRPSSRWLLYLRVWEVVETNTSTAGSSRMADWTTFTYTAFTCSGKNKTAFHPSSKPIPNNGRVNERDICAVYRSSSND